MEILGKIFKQTSWQILGKVVTAVTTFVILGIVARNYGENGVGIYTLALTYLAMFYLLSDFGFNAHVIKKFQILNFKFQIEEFRKLLGTRIIWSGSLTVLAIVLLPFLPFTTRQFSQAVLFGSLAIVGSAVFVSSNLVFQSRLRYDLSVLSSSLGTASYLLLVLWFSSNRLPVTALVFAQMISWIIIGLSSLVMVGKIAGKIIPLFDKKYSIDLFKDSWPIGLTLLLNVVYFRADAFLVAYFKGVADAGIYNVAYSVFQSALVLPTFIMNAYYPMMLKSFKGMNKFFPSEIKLVGLGLFLLASLGTLLTLILAPFITHILTGGGFLGSSQSLQILSLGFPAYFLSSLLMWVLVSKGRYKTLLIIYTFGLAANLILNFLYIPRDSFIAASAITVFCEYLILIMQSVVLLLKL